MRQKFTSMPLRNSLGFGALALVVSGTSGALLSKLMYQLQGPGRDGSVHAYEKPWASTAFMFLGMAACLPAAAAVTAVTAWLRRVEAPPADGSLEHLLLLQRRSPGTPGSATSTATSIAGGLPALWGAPMGASQHTGDSAAGAAASGLPRRRALALILIPTAFDLVATILMSVGLLYVTASTFAMVRGSEVVFAALLSTWALRRHLNRWHQGGIALCTVGITLVGAASFLEGAQPTQAAAESGLKGLPPTPTTGQLLLGIGLVLAAEAVQAAQVVAEDLFMHTLELSPLTVVGYEGLYGVLLMAAILPVVQRLPGREGGGIHEDSLDTLAMLAHCPAIRSAAFWYTAGLAVYNVAGMLVTDSLGAVTRTVLETLKTLLVWVLNLLAFYASHASLGEPWTRHSWLQALGFGVLVAGTLVYAQGEEAQARRLRAKLRWARLRDSLAAVVSAQAAQRPLVPPRIAGPGRIRAAFWQPAAVVQAVERLQELLEEHRAAAAAAEAAVAAAPMAIGRISGSCAEDSGGSDVAAAREAASSSGSFHFPRPSP